MSRYFNILLNESCFFVTRDFNNKGDQIPKSILGIKFFFYGIDFDGKDAFWLWFLKRKLKRLIA